jgi:transcriptional regulator with XRE-family HTH domain
MARPKRNTIASNPQEDSLTHAVSANLRRLRTERGWSMDELSSRSQVSKAMLHQIEMGKSVPTIAVVWRIADGLKIPFSELLTQAKSSSDVVLRRDEAKLLTNAAGTFFSRALFPFDSPARTAEFYEIRLKAGGIEKAAAHAHGTIEHFTVAQGAVEIEVDGTTHRLVAGDCLVFAADKPHVYRHVGQNQEVLAYLMMTYALPGQIHH